MSLQNEATARSFSNDDIAFRCGWEKLPLELQFIVMEHFLRNAIFWYRAWIPKASVSQRLDHFWPLPSFHIMSDAESQLTRVSTYGLWFKDFIPVLGRIVKIIGLAPVRRIIEKERRGIEDGLMQAGRTPDVRHDLPHFDTEVDYGAWWNLGFQLQAIVAMELVMNKEPNKH